jgi:hypothetical protein
VSSILSQYFLDILGLSARIPQSAFQLRCAYGSGPYPPEHDEVIQKAVQKAQRCRA